MPDVGQINTDVEYDLDFITAGIDSSMYEIFIHLMYLVESHKGFSTVNI